MKVPRLLGIAVLLTFVAASGFAGGADEAAATGPVQIEFWQEWAPEGAQGLVLQALADEFNAENEGEIEMTLSYMGGKRNEKYAAALAAGAPPEIAWISGAGSAYYDAGQLVDLDRVYDDVIDRDDIYSTLLEYQSYLGEDITIPFENSNLSVYYNKPMLEEKGIPFPPAEIGEYTWNEFIADAKAFTDVEAGKYGWYPRWSSAVYFSIFWEAGGHLFSEDRKTNLLVSDPEMQEKMITALEMLHRILYVDTITANDVGDQGFGNGDMPFQISGPWDMPRVTKPQGIFEKDEIGIAPFPTLDKTGQTNTYWYQKALALFKKDTVQEEAGFEFIKWFYSAPVHARWCAEASYLPVTKSAAAHPTWTSFAEDNPWVNVFLDQVDIMKRRPEGIPSGDVNKLRDIVRFQEGTPREALEVYQKDAQDLLDEFWATR